MSSTDCALMDSSSLSPWSLSSKLFWNLEFSKESSCVFRCWFSCFRYCFRYFMFSLGG
jgi:hypothetical protein